MIGSHPIHLVRTVHVLPVPLSSSLLPTTTWPCNPSATSKWQRLHGQAEEGVSPEHRGEDCCEMPALSTKLTQAAACSLLRCEEQQRGKASEELAAGIALTADV